MADLTDRQRARLALAAILTLAGLLYVVQVGWGLPAHRSWAWNEPAPIDLERASFGNWRGRYAPFHFYLLAAVFWLADRAQEVGLLSSLPAYHARFLAGRLLGCAMAVGSVGLVYRLARRFADRKTACLGALFTALLPSLVYFAKTMSPDVPYIFWFLLSLHFFLALVARHRLRDWLAYGVSAVLAISSKDQAVGLYVLSPLVAIPSLHWRRRAEERGPAVWRTLADRRLLATAGICVLGYALVNNLVWNFDAWRTRIGRLGGDWGPGGFAIYGSSPVEQARMLFDNVRYTRFELGWPTFLAAVAGLVLVAVRPRRHRALLVLSSFAASLWFVFLPLIHYNYVRFLLPSSILATLFAATALCRLRAAARSPRARRAVEVAIAVMVVYALGRGASVDFKLLADTRYLAEEWLESHLAPGERALALGLNVNLPRPAPWLRDTLAWDRLHIHAPRVLRAVDPRYVVINPVEVENRYRREQYARLLGGAWNYRPIAHLKGRPLLDLLPTAGIETLLDKLVPEIVIVERQRRWAPRPEEVLARAAELRRAPDPAASLRLADQIGAGALPEETRLLGNRIAALGLTRDGWVPGGQTAVVWFRNPTPAPIEAELTLAVAARTEELPVTVSLDDGHQPVHVAFEASGKRTVALGLVPAGGHRLFLIYTDRGWSSQAPGDPRQLGVQISAGTPVTLDDSRLTGYGLTADGWTTVSPAALVIDNDRDHTVRPAILLACAAPAQDLPLRVFIDGTGGRIEHTFIAAGEARLVLDPLPAYTEEVVYLTTDRTFSNPGDPRRLGVRVRSAP